MALAILLCLTVRLFIKDVDADTVDNAPTVIIDAGHGGFDSGAVAFSGIEEKELNLTISKKLYEILSFYGYNVVMTRFSDTALSCENTSKKTKLADMNERVRIMNSYKNAVFLSIHQNKFPQNSSVCGFQAFYKRDDENAKRLAESLQFSVCKALQPENKRLAKHDTRNVFILRNAKIPAVIAECGFLSNREDLNNLCSQSYQNRLCFALAGGIVDYFSEK